MNLLIVLNVHVCEELRIFLASKYLPSKGVTYCTVHLGIDFGYTNGSDLYLYWYLLIGRITIHVNIFFYYKTKKMSIVFSMLQVNVIFHLWTVGQMHLCRRYSCYYSQQCIPFPTGTPDISMSFINWQGPLPGVNVKANC